MPESVLNSQGYIKVRDVEGELKKHCKLSCCPCFGGSSDEANPFNAERAMNDRVEVLGGGVAIGGSSG